MKLNRKIVIGAAALFGGAFYALTQQVNQNPQTPATQAAPGVSKGPRSLAINFQTWEVSSPDYSREELAGLNTAAQRLERSRSAHAILNPVKSGARPGQNPAEIQRDAAAVFSITHPGFLDAQKQPTPQDIEALHRAKDSILNPRATP